MSWVLDISGDAGVDLRGLDLLLQESVLDELDPLCDEPGRIPPPLAGLGTMYAFSTAIDGELRVLVLNLQPEPQRRLLGVLGVRLLPGG